MNEIKNVHIFLKDSPNNDGNNDLELRATSVGFDQLGNMIIMIQDKKLFGIPLSSINYYTVEDSPISFVQ